MGLCVQARGGRWSKDKIIASNEPSSIRQMSLKVKGPLNGQWNQVMM